MKSTPKKQLDGKFKQTENLKSRLNTPMYDLLVNYSFALKFADGK